MNTVPSIGSFVLKVRREGATEWGQLRMIKYDGKSRSTVLESIKTIRDNWGMNYTPYSTAAFRIEEHSIQLESPVLISGPKN